MKQHLQLKLSQQLAMTPQLQQAIRLLQLSTLELQQEIQLALESNPLLEQVDDKLDDNQEETVLDTTFEETSDNIIDTVDALEQRDLPDELPIDATWDDLYSAGGSLGNTTDYRHDELPIYQGETTQTLQDYLLWQVSLTPFTERDNLIAITIVDAINDAGYLTITLEDILEGLGIPDVSIEEIEVVLKRIQHFDPLGVAARSLSECLLVQLNQFSHDTPYLHEAKLIISHHIEALANHDFKGLMKITQLKEDALKEAIMLIQTLEPRPGYSFNQNIPEYIIPDVFIQKEKNGWNVRLNTENIPQLRVNQYYANLRNNNENQQDSLFIRNNLQEAKWLIKSLESRNETLLKVTRCIVEQQKDFFDLGEEHMKPLVLADVAQKVGMHESTISRVTTQKYLYSPRGIFELKYFFSSHVNNDGYGSETSSTAIRAFIKKLIAEENPSKPLSDNKLTTLLAQKGIIVARRTVAKYRESLSIPSSSQRKKLV